MKCDRLEGKARRSSRLIARVVIRQGMTAIDWQVFCFVSQVPSEKLMLTRTIGLDTSKEHEEGHLYALSREALHL